MQQKPLKTVNLLHKTKKKTNGQVIEIPQHLHDPIQAIRTRMRCAWRWSVERCCHVITILKLERTSQQSGARKWWRVKSTATTNRSRSLSFLRLWSAITFDIFFIFQFGLPVAQLHRLSSRQPTHISSSVACLSIRLLCNPFLLESFQCVMSGAPGRPDPISSLMGRLRRKFSQLQFVHFDPTKYEKKALQIRMALGSSVADKIELL